MAAKLLLVVNVILLAEAVLISTEPLLVGTVSTPLEIAVMGP
jgi:hypothetical protein